MRTRNVKEPRLDVTYVQTATSKDMSTERALQALGYHASVKFNRDMQAQLAIRPTRGRVLVRLMEGARISETIIAPDTYRMKFGMGEVLSIGPNKQDDDGNERPTALGCGDVVYFGRWKDVERDGTALIMEDDVILVRFYNAPQAITWLPIHDRIIVAPDDSPTIRFRAPDNADKDMATGKVLSVGTASWQDGHSYPLACSVGDTVMFYEFNRQEFNLDGQKLIVMRDGDVLGKIQ
jgi:chaperonin GroES